MLLTRVSYTAFIARQRYQRGTLRWSWNEVYITTRWDTANRRIGNSCERRCSFCLLSVIASAEIHKCITWSL